ncbi:MAG: hypothetical protein VX519_02125 [Myxococcota bacterium]|nr:hypothetical protein [Myxococcota bacterium]
MTRTPYAEWLGYAGLLFLVAGCRPGVFPDPLEGCDSSPLSGEEVRVYRMECSDVAPEGGVGRKGDWLLENARIKAVIRKPEASLGVVGLGGGTLIDLAPQGGRDVVWEAVPVLNGGWMQPVSMTGGVDSEGGWVRVLGVAMSLEGEPQGGEVEFTWRLRPGASVLEMTSGAGLMMLGEVDVSLAGRWWVGADSVLGVSASGSEDLGGAVVYEGEVSLSVGSANEVGEALWPEGDRASGVCAGDGVRVEYEGEHWATLGPEFDTRVPAEHAMLVCEASAQIDGLPHAPGEGLDLEAGLWGAVRVRVADEFGLDVPAQIQWEGGTHAVAPGGGLVPTGPGRWTLRASGGPGTEVVETSLDVVGEVGWEIVLETAIWQDGWVLAEIGRETHPSRTNRTPPGVDLDMAAAQGRGFVVQTAVDEIVPSSMGRFSEGRLRHRGGVSSETWDVGRVWSWPWEGSSKKAGHGAPDWLGLSGVDLAAVARGPSGERRLVVDSAWVEAAGPVHGWDPMPDAMFVESPDDVGTLVNALNAGAWMGVVGPLSWLPANTTTLPSLAACERPIVLGETIATNGILLKLEVEEGVWAPVPRGAKNLEISLEGRADVQVDAVTLWSSGQVIRRWEPSGGVPAGWSAEASAWSGTWVLAVAEGQDWAVTSPLWLPVEGVSDQPW